MGRTNRDLAGVELERTRARRGNAWSEAGLVAALAAAVALWVVVLAGVAAPLGSALARLDPPPAPPGCAPPPEAVASAAAPSAVRRCP